jgi:lysozyme
MNIAELLEFEEGYSAKAYYCSEGFPTIGIGSRVGPKGSNLRHYDFTVSKSLAKAWLMDEVISIELELGKLDWFQSLNMDKRTVIISMGYQLGLTGLFKFKRMIAALEIKDYREARKQALDSKWHKQTVNRSERHADVLGGELMSSVYS